MWEGALPARAFYMRDREMELFRIFLADQARGVCVRQDGAEFKTYRI